MLDTVLHLFLLDTPDLPLLNSILHTISLYSTPNTLRPLLGTHVATALSLCSPPALRPPPPHLPTSTSTSSPSTSSPTSTVFSSTASTCGYDSNICLLKSPPSTPSFTPSPSTSSTHAATPSTTRPLLGTHVVPPLSQPPPPRDPCPLRPSPLPLPCGHRNRTLSPPLPLLPPRLPPPPVSPRQPQPVGTAGNIRLLKSPPSPMEPTFHTPASCSPRQCSSVLTPCDGASAASAASVTSPTLHYKKSPYWFLSSLYIMGSVLDFSCLFPFLLFFFAIDKGWRGFFLCHRPALLEDNGPTQTP